MQIFAIARTRQGKPASLLEERSNKALSIVTRTFEGTKRVVSEVDGKTLVLAASVNTADRSLAAARSGLRQPLLMGYGGPAIDEAASKFSAGDVLSAVTVFNQAHGMFACALRSEDGRRLLFYCTLTRQIPLYIAQTDEMVAVGNSALLLGLLIRPDLKPVLDRKGLAAFINSNNIFLERTLFENVRLLGINSYAVMDGENLTTAESDTTVDSLSQATHADEKGYFDLLAQRFTDGVKAAAGGRKVISMGLSGGKDSRLVLSGAKAAGLDIKANTNQRFSSEAADRDVLIARQIAAAYGVSHTVKGGENLSETSLRTSFVPRDFAVRTILLRDGIPGLLPRQPSHCRTAPVPGPASDTVTLSGLGGELLRGGYASPDLNWLRQNPELVHDSHKLLKQKLTGRFASIEPGIAKDLEGEIDASIRSFASRTNDPGLLELYYLMYNIGRSGIASYREASARSDLAMPCCDNRLLRDTLANGQRLRLEERPHQEIMERLLPGLADIELAEYRWGSGEARSTMAIMPVALETAPQHYPIYMQLHGGLLEEIRDTVMANTEICSIVSSAKLKELFAPPQINDPTKAAFVWTLYYASLLAGNAWGEPIPGRGVTVDHGRPWYNMLREYCKAFAKEFNAIKSTDLTVIADKSEAANNSICSNLAKKFDSLDFFSEVAARNAKIIAETRQKHAPHVTLSKRLWGYARLRSKTAAQETAALTDAAAIQVVRETLLAQANAVLTDWESGDTI